MIALQLTDQAFNKACSLANALAHSLKYPERNNREQRPAARALAMTMSSIFTFVEADDAKFGEGLDERIEDIAKDAIAVIARFIQLEDDGHDLVDIEHQLAIAGCLVETLDGVVGSSVLSDDALERLSDYMREQLGPTLCLVVRLTDPDKFEFGNVPDDFVQAGFSAMCIAGRLSRLISWADTKAAEGRRSGYLAA